MTVKRGYKLTEVGEIPEDWTVSSLGHIASVKTGPFGTLLSAAEYCEYDGVPMISVGEIRDGFIRVSNETPRIPSTVVRRLPQFVLRAGDIVFGRKGGVDRSAIVNANEDGWFLGSDGISARLLSGIHSLYVAYQFRSKRIQSLLLQNAIGTTMPSLNQQILGHVSIPIPPSFAEQVAIATALSDANALIESLEQLVAKKRLLKQAAIQELLTGKTRLPGFESSDVSVQHTIVGTFPSDWRISTIGAEYDIRLGKMLDAKRNKGVLKPYLGNRDVQWGRIDISQLSMVAMTDSDVAKFRLQHGDLLVCEGGDVGRSAIWKSPINECYFQKALHRLRAKSGFNSNLMIAFLKKWSEEGVLKNFVTQTSIAHLPKEKFLTIPLPIPRNEEQTAIAKVLSDMDAEIESLEARLAKARLIKQGMMQELLTGKIRLV